MTVPNVEIQVDLKELNKVLDRLGQALEYRQLSTIFVSRVEQYLRNRTESRFSNEGDDASGTWAPLKTPTLIFRKRQGYPPGPINVRSGELRRWATTAGLGHSAKGGGVEFQYPQTKPTGELLKKVTTAQRGNKRAVPRLILATNDHDLERIMTEVQTGIEDYVTR